MVWPALLTTKETIILVHVRAVVSAPYRSVFAVGVEVEVGVMASLKRDHLRACACNQLPPARYFPAIPAALGLVRYLTVIQTVVLVAFLNVSQPGLLL